MGQVTIYIDPETEKLMSLAIKSSGLSKSKWISNLIREKTARHWPDSIKESAGAWDDFPLADELRSGSCEDGKREKL